MSKDTRMGLEKIFDFLGEVIAFFGVIIFALTIINYNFAFLPDKVAGVFEIVNKFVGLALLIVVGLEAVIKRNFIIRLAFYLLIAVIIIFLFFPGTYETLINFIPKKG